MTIFVPTQSSRCASSILILLYDNVHRYLLETVLVDTKLIFKSGTKKMEPSRHVLSRGHIILTSRELT